MVFHFDLWCACAYALVFLWLIFRAGQFQWFWGSVFLWLGIGFLGADLLPGIWGITHVGPLFIPHFYLTIASVFFFIDHWKKTPDGRFYQADMSHPLLSLFAVTNLLMSLVFLGWVFMVWYAYPQGMSLFVAPALLKYYALQPSLWFLLQFVLMAVFYFHRVMVMTQSASLFSIKQLQSGLLLVLVVQLITVVAIVLEGRS